MLRPEIASIAPDDTEPPPPPEDPQTCEHPGEEVREKSDRPNRHGVFFTWDECGLCGEQLSPYEIDAVL